MAYVPNPADATAPLDSEDRSTAAAEFRALKAYLQTQLAAIAAAGDQVGDIKICTTNTVQANWISVPLVATNVSRATYPALHAKYAADGYPYGNGDGSTTFGIPHIPADYVPVQLNGNLGTVTPGQMPAHTHSVGQNYGATVGAGGLAQGAGINSGSAGVGTDNLAAGVRLNYVLKVL